MLQGLRRGFWKGLGVFGFAVKWAVVAHCTLEYIADFVICQGPSMEPTIRTKDIIVTEHLSPRFDLLKKGDIVVSRSPTNPNQFICKRVLAVGGDTLLQYNGDLKVIPRGYIWVEGDNERNSTDSRNYGPIPVGLVRGRALVKIWPFRDSAILVPPKSTSDPFTRVRFR